MDIVVLIVAHGALFMTHYPQSVTGIYFTSSPAKVVEGDTGRLTLKCAVNETENRWVYAIKIKRETSPGSNQYQLFASFVQNTATNVDEAKLDDQITINRDFDVRGNKSGTTPYLQVAMSIQKMNCSDARLYTCDYVYESNSMQTLTVYQNATLDVFVLPSMTSLQGRKNGQLVDGGSSSNRNEYNVGDLLQLTCEATIGSINSTQIRWERSSNTNAGYIPANGVAYTISDGTAISDGQCGYTRKSILTYNVTASDSSYPISFQCYVFVNGYPLTTSTPGGNYTTTSKLQYHLYVVCDNGTFGRDCDFTCHCEDDTKCNKVNGSCLNGKCATGWTGPSCQTKDRNILQCLQDSITTSMSSVMNNWTSHRAADGKTGPDPEICHCCSGTQNTLLSWWMVDFGADIPINLIKVYSRSNEKDYRQLEGFQLTLSDNIIYNVTSFTSTSTRMFSRVYELKLPNIITRYIKIERPAILTLCEVKLFQGVCGLGSFGHECAQMCHCADNRPCDVDTGYCQSTACKTGWQRQACNEKCSQDTFGEECSEKCYCAEGTCTHNYGICPGKCRSGYRGPHCNEAVSAMDTKSFVVGGAAGATVALLAVAVIIGFIVYRVRRKNRLSGKNVYATPNVYVTPKETLTYDILDKANDIQESESNIYENEKVTGI